MTLAVLDFETITPEYANELWRRIQSGLVDDFTINNPDLFAAKLCAPNTVCFEHPSGIAMLSSICPRLGAELHFWSWDNVSDDEIVHFGREVVAYAFDTYELERLTATPPAFNKMAIRIAGKLGFTFEGNVRHAFLFKSKYHDVHIYGLLRSEFERGRVN